MKKIFSVDGRYYNVFVPEGGIKRSAAVLDGENATRSKAGSMIRDIIGTYYNYTIEMDTSGLNASEYDALYETLTAPVDYHVLTVPYGQKTLTFNAYVSNAEDTLKSMDKSENHWGNLSVNFIAMAPARR